jgi:hypothetical protein
MLTSTSTTGSSIDTIVTTRTVACAVSPPSTRAPHKGAGQPLVGKDHACRHALGCDHLAGIEPDRQPQVQRLTQRDRLRRGTPAHAMRPGRHDGQRDGHEDPMRASCRAQASWTHARARIKQRYGSGVEASCRAFSSAGALWGPEPAIRRPRPPDQVRARGLQRDPGDSKSALGKRLDSSTMKARPRLGAQPPDGAGQPAPPAIERPSMTGGAGPLPTPSKAKPPAPFSGRTPGCGDRGV